MKKLALLGAAILALAACNKSQTVTAPAQPGEIAFKTVANVMTKANPQLTGTTLGESNNLIRMYVYATTNTANGAVENPAYMDNQRFKWSSSNLWHACSSTAADPVSVYWPLGGGSVDFLAYAYYYNASSGSTANFDGQIATPTVGANKADQVVFPDQDLYTNDLDLMYAAANSQRGGATNGNYKPVPLVFHHAGAVIELNITSSVAITVNEVRFGNLIKEAAAFADNEYATLDKIGTLTVDNTKNVLSASWSNVDQTTNTKYTSLVAFKGFSDLALAAATPSTEDNVIIMPQPKLNFIIKYTDAAGKWFYVTAPVPKGEWLAGHKYVYNVTMTFSEIEVAESVIDYTPESATDIGIN